MAPQKLFESSSSQCPFLLLSLSDALSFPCLFFIFVVEIMLLLSVVTFYLLLKYILWFLWSKACLAGSCSWPMHRQQTHTVLPTGSNACVQTQKHAHVLYTPANLSPLFGSAPLPLWHTKLCQLFFFKCSLIVWPQGGPKTHTVHSKTKLHVWSPVCLCSSFYWLLLFSCFDSSFSVSNMRSTMHGSSYGWECQTGLGETECVLNRVDKWLHVLNWGSVNQFSSRFS